MEGLGKGRILLEGKYEEHYSCGGMWGEKETLMLANLIRERGDAAKESHAGACVSTEWKYQLEFSEARSAVMPCTPGDDCARSFSAGEGGGQERIYRRRKRKREGKKKKRKKGRRPRFVSEASP